MIQGSEEWKQARLGKITASRFKDCLPQPKSKKDQEAGLLSVTTQTYVYECFAEILTGEAKEVSGKALDWGNHYEPFAREAYEERTFTVVEEVGFIEHKVDTLIGASSDGFVGDDGMIEIKCPHNSTNHARTLTEGMPKEHMAQIQGQMWVLDKKWCDFVSYDPRVKDDRKLYVQRIERNDEFIDDLSEKVYKAVDALRKLAS